jgi:hypothetical protein
MRYLKLRSSQEKLKMKKRARAQEALFQRELNKVEGDDPLWDLTVKKNSTQQSKVQ